MARAAKITVNWVLFFTVPLWLPFLFWASFLGDVVRDKNRARQVVKGYDWIWE